MFVNEAFLRPRTASTREQVIGKTHRRGDGSRRRRRARRRTSDRAFAGEAVTYERAVVDAQRPHALDPRAHACPDLHFDGTIKGVYVVGHDITDLKQAQDTLAARESQLRAIMDGVPAPVAYIDRDERCHYVNRTFLQYFGLTPEQVATLRLRDVVGHGIYQSAQAMLARALEGESTAFDRLVPGANGVARWMTIRVVPDASPSGEVHGAFVLMNDIHGLKQAQEALRASEAELRLIMDNVPARVVVHRPRLPLPLPQPPQRGMAGREPQGAHRAARRRRRRRRALRADQAAARPRAARARRCRAEQHAGAARRRRSAGNRSTTRRTATRDGNVIGIYAVHTDVHDQKRNEDALRRANWMLSSHISNTPLAVLEWDRDFRLVRWSPQAENIFGWSERRGAAACRSTDNPLLHEDDRERDGRARRAADERRGAARDRPHAQLPQGRRRRSGASGTTRRCSTTHGEIVSILSFVQDVSLAHPGRGAAAVPGDARRADRAAEPAAAARAPGAGDRAGASAAAGASACCSSTSTASRTSTTRSATGSATSS